MGAYGWSVPLVVQILPNPAGSGWRMDWNHLGSSWRYTVEIRDTLDAGEWLVLANDFPLPGFDHSHDSHAFHRVRADLEL